MRISVLIGMPALSLALAFLPVAATAHPHSLIVAQAAAAAPTPDQVKAAVKQALMNANLTLHQKREIKGFLENYKSQTVGADDATKRTAQKALLQNIYGSLTPAQQTEFKASIKQSLGADITQQ